MFDWKLSHWYKNLRNTRTVKENKRTFTIRTPYGPKVFKHFRKVTRRV